MSFRMRPLFLVIASLPLALPTFAQSGTPAPMTPLANPDPRLAAIHARTSGIHAPGQVALSPDGSTVAYTLRQREGSTLHLIAAVNPDPGKERLITPDGETACSNSSPVWSPDSETLAFTSSCTSKQEKPGQDQIFLWSRATGTVRQLTHVTGLFNQVAWAPDGKSLAFLFVENATRSAGALAAMTPWSGVIGQDHVEIQRVASMPVALNADKSIIVAPIFLTPPDLHVYEFAFSPKSDAITFIAANPPGENNWWVAKLYTEAPMMRPQVVFDPNTTTSALHGLQIAVPRFSPDGKRVAFIGGLMSDQGSTGGDIWVIPADSKANNPTDITPAIDGTPTWFTWLNASTVGFVEDRSGRVLLADANADKDMVVPGSSDDLGEINVTGGPIKMAVSSSEKGTVALIESGHNQAPEVFAGPPNALRQVTHLNDGVKPPARTESVEWTDPVTPGSADVFHVQGWLTYPANYDPAKKYPLLVTVHGGPSAGASAQFGGSTWAQLGYFVFAPNPRGSFGQGEKFTAANRKDFGYGDLRDIEAGMDSIEAKLPAVDHTREGLTGWSYGGFMTMFGVTQTHRFKAAVAGAGLSDWLSYYGENSIDQWMVPFFGATVYDDPAVYAKSSAINFIKDVTTPTLIVVGDRDGECPAPQSFEFWHALRAEHVPTELVVFPNEGHGFRDPGHIRDLEAREVAWFDKYMTDQNMAAQ